MLTRHATAAGPRLAYAGRYLPPDLTVSALLALPRAALTAALQPGAALATDPLLPPIEAQQEVWACGVTYLRSRDARQAESSSADVYTRVYTAERPEVFFKAVGWRVSGAGGPVGIRHDSQWDVPEPELTLVVNAHGEIIGYTAGNDLSSRSIEGENPLYLPQAKTYRHSCALGPGIVLAHPAELRALPIALAITRAGQSVFSGTTSSAQLKRDPAELVSYLRRALDFPDGAFLMTGTGIVPPESFTLQPADIVTVTVGALTLTNPVIRV
jgi:2-dehydro-3-deoxy-D-arabinonate dehydratase